MLPWWSSTSSRRRSGSSFPWGFWRRFCRIENVAAIKVAPFNRYRTIDVAALAKSVRTDEIFLYTGNDDTIIADLLTPLRFPSKGARSKCAFAAASWATGPYGRARRK